MSNVYNPQHPTLRNPRYGCPVGVAGTIRGSEGVHRCVDGQGRWVTAVYDDDSPYPGYPQASPGIPFTNPQPRPEYIIPPLWLQQRLRQDWIDRPMANVWAAEMARNSGGSFSYGSVDAYRSAVAQGWQPSEATKQSYEYQQAKALLDSGVFQGPIDEPADWPARVKNHEWLPQTVQHYQGTQQQITPVANPDYVPPPVVNAPVVTPAPVIATAPPTPVATPVVTTQQPVTQTATPVGPAVPVVTTTQPPATPPVTTTAPPQTAIPPAEDDSFFPLPDEIFGISTTFLLIAAAGVGAWMIFARN